MIIVCPSVFDGNVATLSITGLAHSFTKCRHEMCVQFGRTGAKKPNHRHRLLRARRERPRRCRAAEQR